MQIWPLLFSAWACLDYESFNRRLAEKECETLTTCNPGIPCDPPDTGGDEGCEFDKSAAKDCLSGAFTCNSDNPGFEYVIAPQVCATVCL